MASNEPRLDLRCDSLSSLCYLEHPPRTRPTEMANGNQARKLQGRRVIGYHGRSLMQLLQRGLYADLPRVPLSSGQLIGIILHLLA